MKATMMRLPVLALTLAALGLLVSCDESPTGPGGAGSKAVSLSFGLKGGSASPAPGLFAAGYELTDGLNTMVIESAELVLREIEFERVDAPDCDLAVEEDACEDFELGPYLVALPLDGSVSQEIKAVIDTGTYDEIEFDVHKVSDGDPANDEFLAANPDFADISIRVMGTYNGEAFEYTSDFNEEQEIELTSPLVVTPESGAVNATLTVDMSAWFSDGLGGLLDPRTAAKGDVNEDLVEDNIRDSIEGFRDDDHDGVSHDDDTDEERD